MQLRDALAARAKAAPSLGAADARLADNPGHNPGHSLGDPAPGSALPPDATAVIYCPTPPVVTSGRRNAAEWVLEFEPRAPRFIEPLMGWTGSTDPLSQVRLRFPHRQAAEAYARRQGLQYSVREPSHIRGGDLNRARQRPQAGEHQLPLDIAWALEAPHFALDRLGTWQAPQQGNG
jgi:hypothetical protein